MDTSVGFTCIGHSGFIAYLPNYNLIFDYYTDKTGVIKPDIFAYKKTCVFVSHSHADHYNKDIFKWSAYGDVSYILDTGCLAPDGENIIKMQENDSISLYNGTVNVKAYGSTDEGLSFLVKLNDIVLFHAGDLNDWHWEEKSEQSMKSEENYLRIIKQLAGQHIDAAFIPKDPRLGPHADRGIRHFKDIVKPKRIIPMHFPGNDGTKY